MLARYFAHFNVQYHGYPKIIQIFLMYVGACSGLPQSHDLAATWERVALLNAIENS